MRGSSRLAASQAVQDGARLWPSRRALVSIGFHPGGPHMMRDIGVSIIVFVCMTVASLGGMLLFRKLPESHRNEATHSVIKIAAGVFVLMASLVLGLLVNSVKNTYEGVDRNVHAFATELILLDRTLRHYGPDAAEPRAHLAAYTQQALDGTWPATGNPVVEDRKAEQLLDQVELSVRKLSAADADRADLRRLALQRLQTIVQLRWTLIEAARGTVYAPLFLMLIAWLTLIFASIGFNAPPNPMVIATLVVSAFVIAASLYLVLDMDVPFEGPVRVSSAPMVQALDYIRR